jgi:hypothetical protein
MKNDRMKIISLQPKPRPPSKIRRRDEVLQILVPALLGILWARGTPTLVEYPPRLAMISNSTP